MRRDLGLLTLRLAAGGLLAGHGAQKLFGAFGGHGLEGTAGWMESLGLAPGDRWALAAGAGEFGSGALTALGFLGPVGPLSIFGPMLVATRTVHADKPVWVTSGGPELPMLYMAAGATLAMTGPGRLSLDRALGIRVPAIAAFLTAGLVAAGTLMALTGREEPTPQEQPQPTAGEDAVAQDETTTALAA